MPGSTHQPGGPEMQRRPDDDPPKVRYDPSAVAATRERSKGLGMGERDLERQRDPHRPSAPPEENDRPDGD